MDTSKSTDEPAKKNGGSTELPSQCVYELNDAERADIEALVQALPTPEMQSLDDERFLMEVALASDELPRAIRERLTDFGNNSNEYGALLFRGLLPDAVPETPADKRSALQKKLSVSEKGLLLIMSRLGDPRGYADELWGMLLQPVHPVKGSEYKQENSSSLEFLEIHTEDGFLEERCDFLGLLCLRPDHEREAKTATASVRHALELIPGSVIEWLRKPLYVISVPSSFGAAQQGDAQAWSKPMAVLSGDYLMPDMCVDLDAMKGITNKAQIALDMFAHALRAVLVPTRLVERDLLIIDNYMSAHARSTFTPRYDGKDRWLQRVKVVANPRSSRMGRCRGSRICGPVALEIGDEIDLIKS